MSKPKRKRDDATTGVAPILWLNVDQTAEALQLNYYSVLRMIHAGEIAAKKFGKEWRVPVQEIEAVAKDLMARSAEVRAAKAIPAA